MKILFMAEGLGGGGKERRMVELIKGLCEDNSIDVHIVLTKSDSDYPEIHDLPVSVHRLYEFSNFSLVFAYVKLFFVLKPDVVHAWSFKSSAYAAFLKFLFGFRLISGFIGDSFGFSIWRGLLARTVIFRKSDVIVCNSRAGLEAYSVPPNKGVVIYNGFSFSRISRKNNSGSNYLNIKTPLVVVMLANVTRYKNYNLFLEIAEEVVQKRGDVTFISIGKVWPEFVDLVDPYMDGKHPRIKFLGFRQDVEDIIKNCDVGLLCTYREGLSNAIIELMANSVPVITNDKKGGSGEIISSWNNGVICDDEEMISSLLRLLDNFVERGQMAERARLDIKTKFSLSAMVDRYKKIY